MNHARIEQLGTPAEIYERPRTAFAADFIGISTALRGQVRAGRLETPEGNFQLPPDAACADGSDALLVIRPERLALGEGGNTISGTVTDFVYAGAETRLLFRLKSGTEAVLRLPIGLAAPPIGAAVTARWEPGAAVVVPL
jgi:putative spermidine/putrescine transport system ATP-binding protein